MKSSTTMQHGLIKSRWLPMPMFIHFSVLMTIMRKLSWVRNSFVLLLKQLNYIKCKDDRLDYTEHLESHIHRPSIPCQSVIPFRFVFSKVQILIFYCLQADNFPVPCDMVG